MSSYERRIAEALEGILAKAEQGFYGTPSIEDEVPELLRENREYREWVDSLARLGAEMKPPPAQHIPNLSPNDTFETTDLDLGVSLPGEQAFVEVIRLIREMFEGASDEQKETLIALHIENVRAWNKFWKVGDDG